MAAPLNVLVPLQPKQEQLLDLVENSPYGWIGYGGSRGGAKSHGIRSVMLIRRLRHAGSRGLIFRRTFDDLWENHIVKLFEQFPYMRDWYNTQHKELTFPNGSVIRFGYAEHEKDIYAFQGKEYMDIAIDEATHLKQSEIEFLFTCNRRGSVKSGCKMILSMNPGNVGHEFIKRIFLDHDYLENEKPNDYAFIQAYGWDNCFWVQEELAECCMTDRDFYQLEDEQRFQMFLRSNYGSKLNALPEAMRIGHLLGDWYQFAGQYFDIWNPRTMTVTPQEVQLKSWWPRWISIDWGFEHNLSAHWHCATPQDEKGRRTIYTYREWVTDHKVPDKIGEVICQRSKYRDEDGEEKFENIDAIYMDAPRDKRTDEDSVYVQIERALRKYGLQQSVDWPDKDRVGGWMLMYQLLMDGEWKIVSTDAGCPEAIRAIPSLIRDPDFKEDILKTDSKADDVADDLRMGLKSRLKHWKRKPPLEERVLARLNPELDPTVRAIQVRKVLQEERKASKPLHIVRPSRHRAGVRINNFLGVQAEPVRPTED